MSNSLRVIIIHPMYCSSPVSSVHGILQARTLEWVVILFSQGSNLSLLHCGQILYYLSHHEAQTLHKGNWVESNKKTTTNTMICRHLKVTKEESVQTENQNNLRNRRQNVLKHFCKHNSPCPLVY